MGGWASVIGKLLLGLAAGYLLVSVAESFLHDNIQHASRKSRDLWRRHPRLCRPLWRAWYSHHVIHHARTFRRDHVTQFETPAEECRLRTELEDEGHARIVRERYGLTLGGAAGVLLFASPLLPVYLVLVLLVDDRIVLGMLVPLALWPFMSRQVHPLLHRGTEEALAEQEPGPMTRWMRSTRYFRRVARYHWMHHKYTHCNYNLLIGGDWLRGRLRRPSPEDRAEMDGLGLLE